MSNKNAIKDLMKTIDIIKAQRPTNMLESMDQITTLLKLYDSLEYHVKLEQGMNAERRKAA